MVLSESGDKYAQIKHCLQVKTGDGYFHCQKRYYWLWSHILARSDGLKFKRFDGFVFLQTWNFHFWVNYSYFKDNLKLQSVSLPLCHHLCLKTCNCSCVRNYLLAWVVRRRGSSADESKVLRRCMCSCQSPHRCGYLLYFAITDSRLRLGIYDPNKNFHHLLSSEQVSMPSLFWPTEEKSITINCATNSD